MSKRAWIFAAVAVAVLVLAWYFTDGGGSDGTLGATALGVAAGDAAGESGTDTTLAIPETTMQGIAQQSVTDAISMTGIVIGLGYAFISGGLGVLF